MKVIIAFTFCCDNLWKSKFMTFWKSLENSEFFLQLCGHPHGVATRTNRLDRKTLILSPILYSIMLFNGIIIVYYYYSSDGSGLMAVDISQQSFVFSKWFNFTSLFCLVIVIVVINVTVFMVLSLWHGHGKSWIIIIIIYLPTSSTDTSKYRIAIVAGQQGSELH